MKTVKKWKRRRPGIYLARTRKHLRPLRRENGYVGRSVNVPLRIRQHMGQDRRHMAKPWSDLDPQWWVLRVPWWLGWKWVLAPLELTAILLLLPRYNHQFNLANPRRIRLTTQAAQRAERNGAGRAYHVRAVLAQYVWRAAGLVFILAGLCGYALTR